MLSFLNKKTEETKEEEKPNSKIENLLSAKDRAHLKEEKKVMEKQETNTISINKKEENYDELTKECIKIGMDIKNDVEKISKGFFNSKNSLKKEAYLKFQSYISTLSYEKKKELENIEYLTFKEKEEQITTLLKNGFAQFISKGATLDEETRRTIEFIFGDIKKLPSKGHRYWYFKLYIWQKRVEN